MKNQKSICPVGNPIFLAHIWILHEILDRIASILFCFKNFYLKSKYPNRVQFIWFYVSNLLDFLESQKITNQNPSRFSHALTYTVIPLLLHDWYIHDSLRLVANEKINHVPSKELPPVQNFQRQSSWTNEWLLAADQTNME